MLSFIGSIVICYFCFRILDAIFRPRQKLPTLKPGQSIIQHTDGNYYVVQEAEEPGTPESLPQNVTRLQVNKK